MLALLAEGLSGAQIASKLVLSPETVRTHIRNAMAKLGAATRSQAVALALRDDVIGESEPFEQSRSEAARGYDPATLEALEQMLKGLTELYDVEGGAVYLVDDDGLALRRAASAGMPPISRQPETVALGQGPLGQAALDRRAQLLQAAAAGASGTLIAAPIAADEKPLGVIALVARISRPVGRRELLLLQAFAQRVGTILATGSGVDRRLSTAGDRFRNSWLATVRLAP